MKHIKSVTVLIELKTFSFSICHFLKMTKETRSGRENNKIQFEIKSHNLNRIKFSSVLKAFGLTRLHGWLAKYITFSRFSQFRNIKTSRLAFFSRSYLDLFSFVTIVVKSKWTLFKLIRTTYIQFKIAKSYEFQFIISHSAKTTIKFNFTTSNFHENSFEHAIINNIKTFPLLSFYRKDFHLISHYAILSFCFHG
jgi:hypothetical protein